MRNRTSRYPFRRRNATTRQLEELPPRAFKATCTYPLQSGGFCLCHWSGTAPLGNTDRELSALLIALYIS